MRPLWRYSSASFRLVQKIVNVADSMFHVFVEFDIQNDVIFTNDFFFNNVTVVASIKVNGDQPVNAPDNEYWKVGNMGQSVSDLPNVVDSVPDTGKDMQGHCQRVASLIGVVGSAEGKEEAEKNDHQHKTVDLV